MQTSELIARLKAATGPDRNIDKALAPLVGLRMVEEGHPLGCCCYDEKGHGVPLPAFTASIDAALTLVPANAFWSVTMRGENRGGYDACCAMPDSGGLDWHEGPTPALAIVIAALRAKGEG